MFAVYRRHDKVKRSELWNVLWEYGAEDGLLNMVRTIYDGSSAYIKINLMLSNWFNAEQGIRQGCVTLPWLCNIFIDNCIRNACYHLEMY